ncbi:MAG: 5-formyltetrahydrofolate cyclo-ligase [Dongiaceae bacterium]
MSTPSERDAAIVLDASKRALRFDMTARRRDAAPSLGHAGSAARDRLIAAIKLPPQAAVSGYWPLADEFDPRPILQRLNELGHDIGLPVVLGRGQPLLFRRWRPGMNLVQGSFKVMTPPPESPELVPNVVLAPILAFDRAGYRLGYGGGFYDRTLARLRANGEVLAIGTAFAMQEVPEVPHDDTDQPLNWIVTEREARAFAIGRRGRAG